MGNKIVEATITKLLFYVYERDNAFDRNTNYLHYMINLVISMNDHKNSQNINKYNI